VVALRQHAEQKGHPAGKNALVKALLQAAPLEQQRMRLRLLADSVHEGLKQAGPDGDCWDVWLQPRVMQALQQWRESLGPTAWAQAARIAGQLAGGQRVTHATLAPWRLAWRGHCPTAVHA
jgi:hypothetical protein